MSEFETTTPAETAGTTGASATPATNTPPAQAQPPATNPPATPTPPAVDHVALAEIVEKLRSELEEVKKSNATTQKQLQDTELNARRAAVLAAAKEAKVKNPNDVLLLVDIGKVKLTPDGAVGAAEQVAEVIKTRPYWLDNSATAPAGTPATSAKWSTGAAKQESKIVIPRQLVTL